MKQSEWKYLPTEQSERCKHLSFTCLDCSATFYFYKKSKPLSKKQFIKLSKAIQKLEEVLKIGGTVEEACTYARIAESSYFEWSLTDDDFRSRMEAARKFVDIASKNVVAHSIVKQGSVSSAMYWLNNHEFKQNANGPMAPTGPNPVLSMPSDERRSFNEEFKKFLKSFYAPTQVAV